jgi:beta-xylosidase
VKQTDLLMRELALLVAIATIPAEAQAVYEAGCVAQESRQKEDRVNQREVAPQSERQSRAFAREAEYQNPIWNQDFPDPFVLAWDGKFYAYATETRVTGFQVMESRDLVKWEHKGVALKVPWSKKHYWAPEVVHYRGKFYMTYSAENPANKKHDIGIAIASNPLGPFEHAAKLVEAESGQRGVIDATIFFEADGSPYIIYSEEDPRSIILRPMAPDLLSVREERLELIRPDRLWERGVVEAPTMLYRNGLYHLFYSAGPFQGSKTGGSYCVSHAVAKNLRGPYRKREKPLLETVDGKTHGPGHQCILTTPDAQMWMFYHGWSDEKQPRYGSNPDGRTLRMDRLVWDGDEPIVKGPTLTRQPAPIVKTKRIKPQLALAVETAP